jgi:predicted ArsR family transcriptional regulator
MRTSSAAVVAPARPSADEAGTRRRVLRLVAADGPITASRLAAELELTSAAIRRHLTELEQSGQVEVRDAHCANHAGRGRPARHYVVTPQGQGVLAQRYAELAEQALEFLAATAGPEAVAGFAERRADQLAARLAGAVDAADDVAGRVEAVAVALDRDGYAATVRPVPGTGALQLCQGHCPVQDVAAAFPELCEAETRALSQVLGVHVQRLVTLASGGHVCTTSIPTGAGAARPAVPSTPTRATSAEGPIR